MIVGIVVVGVFAIAALLALRRCALLTLARGGRSGIVRAVGHVLRLSAQRARR